MSKVWVEENRKRFTFQRIASMISENLVRRRRRLLFRKLQQLFTLHPLPHIRVHPAQSMQLVVKERRFVVNEQRRADYDGNDTKKTDYRSLTLHRVMLLLRLHRPTGHVPSAFLQICTLMRIKHFTIKE